MEKSFFQRLNAPTPEWWGKVRNTCVLLAAALGAGWAAISGLSEVPEGWGKYVGIAIGVLTVIATYAQQKDDVLD